MTIKKWKKKEFKRLVSLGWPRYVASRYVRNHSLASMGYKSVDDLTIGRYTYFNKERLQIIRIYEDDRWETIQLTEEEWNGFTLSFYYD